MAYDARLLQRLADAEAIRRVLARYCELVDARDADGVAAEVFTENAVDDHGLFGAPAVGRDGIAAMFHRSNLATEASAHFLSQSTVDVDGDGATARTYVTGWTWLRDSAHLGRLRAADFVFTGMYDDELRRQPDGWRISRRIVRPLGPGAVGMGALPQVYRGSAGVVVEDI